MNKYLSVLPEKTSLQIFNDDDLIFESEGKWLHPLFDFEEFLKNYNGPKDKLCSHDSAIGKAAAVLSVRNGIRKINADLLSENAKSFIENYNKENPDDTVELKWTNLIPKLMCATENQLEPYNDIDEMYILLRQRAKKVQGVDVEVKNLSHSFGYIKNISFNLKAGGRLMITGENGAGKSTILKIISGIIKNYEGSVLIDGKRPSETKKFEIGYIPQFSDSSDFSLSVEEVTGLGIKKNKSEKIINALKRTCSLNLLKRSFNTLSGGEKQKVQLSRCLAQEARLLLLDEPTASLDAENKKTVMDILRSLSVSEIPTIIVVTHDKDLLKFSNWEKLEIKEDESE